MKSNKVWCLEVLQVKEPLYLCFQYVSLSHCINVFTNVKGLLIRLHYLSIFIGGFSVYNHKWLKSLVIHDWINCLCLASWRWGTQVVRADSSPVIVLSSFQWLATTILGTYHHYHISLQKTNSTLEILKVLETLGSGTGKWDQIL